ncbi:glycosyltransferase [Fusibacter bizertensis]
MNQMNILKQNIVKIVEKGDLTNGELLIEEYSRVYGKDSNYYSIKSVIMILKGNLYDAEQTVMEAIQKNEIDCDILHNLIFILDSNGKSDVALEYRILSELLPCDNSLSQIDLEPNKVNSSGIVLGTVEIANQMHAQSEALKNLGFKTTTLNYYDSYLKYKSDYAFNLKAFDNFEHANLQIKKMVAPLIRDNDIFHFHFATTLALDNTDMPLLKKMGKKVIMQYWGSDVRLLSIAKKHNPYTKVKETNEDVIKKRLETISKYISHCFVDFELAEYVKNYHKHVHITRASIDLNQFVYSDTQDYSSEKLLIVHAASSPEFKGTKYIVKAIESLKSKYNFDFELITGMSNEEAIEIYKKADIIIDQLHFGTYGVFAIEAMALGKPVVSWVSEYMRELLPKELPIIIANQDTIKRVLMDLLDNQDQLKQIGKESRAYVEKYHDSNLIAKNHIEIYNSL